MSARCVFFVGGTRSGKSGMAQRWAEAVAPQRLYLATCWAEDEEMARRVARHQDMRGAGWQCLEEPLNPAAALDRLFAAATQTGGVRASQTPSAVDGPTAPEGPDGPDGLAGPERPEMSECPGGTESAAPGVILLDCVSLWIANLLARDQGEEAILRKVSALGERLAAPPVPVAVVSAETGLGLVPMSPLGRAFNDVLGLANQELARVCHHVVFVSCGLPLALKGALPEELC
ncbi:bifunctional adenosylcobinamide kinase/adenosylcobinamide-phosphate guanylyltransferase [Desulfovibrio sp. 86]|uniref:Adenosylcobinamide kinase n=1 Tax=uncultured Desulfovibrio sp. TaxID=167968 RepID=A0A212L8S2_9BACT|nr:bifunctional adenosylcobinamide kinase/adenosylcobinamide-phosphate guanylyltransferase [Desulfovibrio sp. 86]SCM73936.1 Adenosyl cobinamide kinase/adenosyl cobinamide phosphate guanylyltransferase-like protein [uncultured Desulfovibrio sp.]VZH34537.1 Adenosyl cobinamide kinase/adenosyl cobinamide phosphate guanylyltransferase-like protein [Desulfovibrio sp. 86]